MKKLDQIRTALVTDPTGCGDDCCRFEVAQMIADYDRMERNEQPQMANQEEDIRRLRRPRHPAECSEGCSWLQRARDMASRYLDRLQRWRVDQKARAATR
jgi:hypothetical protein